MGRVALYLFPDALGKRHASGGQFNHGPIIADSLLMLLSISNRRWRRALSSAGGRSPRTGAQRGLAARSHGADVLLAAMPISAIGRMVACEGKTRQQAS